MLDQNLILENEKILLRPISEQDFPSLISLANDPSLWIYFTYDLSVPGEFEEWAHRNRLDLARKGISRFRCQPNDEITDV